MPRAVLLIEGKVSPAVAESCEALDVIALPNVERLASPLPRLLMAPAALVRTGLKRPYSGFIEAGTDQPLDEAAVAAVAQGGLFFSATTEAMMADDPCLSLAEAIGRLGPGVARILPNVELALVEVVANALIHGNLGIDSGMRISAAGLSEFNQRIANALRDPMLKRRRVRVTALVRPSDGLVLIVTDQGAGYAIERELARPVEAFAKSGRGLDLIRKLTRHVEGADCGRTIRMVFSL